MMQKSRRSEAWIGVGLALGAIGALFTLPRLKFLKSAHRARGVVVDQGVRPGTDDYRVFIDFFGGDTRRRFSIPAQFYQYSDGDLVPLLYDPLDPRRVVLDRFWSMWTAWGLLLLVGPALCIGALFLPRRRHRA